jgi:hypothetical protein
MLALLKNSAVNKQSQHKITFKNNVTKVVQGKCLTILRFIDSHAICKSKSEKESANPLSTEKKCTLPKYVRIF